MHEGPRRIPEGPLLEGDRESPRMSHEWPSSLLAQPPRAHNSNSTAPAQAVGTRSPVYTPLLLPTLMAQLACGRAHISQVVTRRHFDRALALGLKAQTSRWHRLHVI